tara:strand:+ start:1438 stop:3516 length:2079 start_codon:yes stop_codon:yes gene_type:complete
MTSSFRRDLVNDNIIYEDVNGSTETVIISTTSFDANGDGTGIAAPPDKLSSFQTETFTNLMKISPKGWQNQIKRLKTDFPDQLGSINAYTDNDINKFDSEKLDLYFKNKEVLTNSFLESEEETDAKIKWLNKTKNSPAAKSGALTGDERWEQHKKNNPDAIKGKGKGVGSDSETSYKKEPKANPCKNNFFSDVETTLDNFINLISRAQNIDIAGEIKGVTKLISGKAKKFVGQMSNALSDGLTSWVSSGLDMGASKIFNAIPKFGKALKAVVGWQKGLIAPIKKIFDAVGCLANKVTNALTDTITDMLTGMAKNVLNGVACAAQSFVGAITNKITSMIDGFVSPFTGPLSKLMGGAFKIKGLLSKGVNIMKKIGNFFNCSDSKSDCPATDNYVIDGNAEKPKGTNEQQGFMKGAFRSANNAFDKIEKDGLIDTLVPGEGGPISGITKQANKFEEKYGKWKVFGSEVGDADTNLDAECYAGNIFKCGAPKVSLFGGNGIGGAGKVLLGKFIDKLDPDDIYGDIRRTASIVGVKMEDPGEGYTEAPYVSFTDNCNQGKGAFGKAIIDKNINSPTYGQITDVIITSEGENYPVDAPAEVGDVYIDKIIVENPGVGYDAAYIDNDECLELIIKDGRIDSVDIKCQKPYTYIPQIVIKNAGSDAVLRPVMSTQTRIVQQELIQSIDCVGDFPNPGDS